MFKLLKILVCPFQIFIGKSSLRSFMFATIIAFNYQYLLTKKNYTAYLLNNENRTSFLDANKEGIYSCIGYLAIYLGSQSVYLRLSNIFNQKFVI